ncbi:uncharacterized protein LOC111388701 [Olea europaea var. sylvestris]|uniref:uncharacterized protein LOC111388701 n=1 Tax=Olea europaea var. sylvestris TaxID=158386 RepID=UPI000C1D0CC1|nr:uncharacterized protein LOC111388701 [Olea europaea var. sylvestris]
MVPPKTKKEVQKLTGRVTALNKFMSRAADKWFPFFKVLRENRNFEWDEEYERAFHELKKMLASPPILTKHEHGDTLYLYLAVSQNAVSGVLVKSVNKAQQPIYYVSKVLLDAKTRYTLAEQLALALVVVAQLLKWAIELGEFDIENKSRPSIKAQALADFIAELTPRPRGPGDNSDNRISDTWNIFVDGASNSSSFGAGVIITSPDKLVDIQCALRFEFEATNNEAEHEAIIIALELEHIKIFSDSQLVVGQIEGTFERKEEKMSLYCLKVHDLQRQFKSCEIINISRADNGKADALSRLVFMGIDGLERTVHVKLVMEPSITHGVGVMDIDHEPSWIDPIVEFINNGNLPEDPRLSRSIKSRASRYCMIGGVLFRRSFTLPYLRRLKPSESSRALAEVHEGVCGNHQGARALAFKLIRYGYY